MKGFWQFVTGRSLFWAIVVRGEMPQPAKSNRPLTWADSLKQIQAL
jgi:hypothetical protein